MNNTIQVWKHSMYVSCCHRFILHTYINTTQNTTKNNAKLCNNVHVSEVFK